MAGFRNERAIFFKTAGRLGELGGRVRIYRMSSNGLKLRALEEMSAQDFGVVIGYHGLEDYMQQRYGDGYYCAKLFSTKYGKNILECRYDFSV